MIIIVMVWPPTAQKCALMINSFKRSAGNHVDFAIPQALAMIITMIIIMIMTMAMIPSKENPG